uniref:Protein PAIR1 n=1 Tax=Vitis vinifera TaxID=29760 RepID=F6I634_VITVI
MKINKACDLSSISVLPPHTRRSSTVPTGPQVSQQLRSQQQSQQSFSQSQHGMFSQFSQNSLDEIVANDQRFGSQERENSMKRISCLAPVSFTREESQIPISRSSTSLARKWSSASAPDYRCQIGEDLEHRIGMMETSLTRFGMILDSIQSDVMQVNKGMKEFLMEMEGLRQKLTVHDSSLLLMSSSYCASPKEKPQPLKKPVLPTKVCMQATLPPKIEMGSWNSVQRERATFPDRNSNRQPKQNGVSPLERERECRVIIDSDEEIDGGFSCLLQEKESGNHLVEEVKEETERILRKARRRKRKYSNTIILN